MGDTSMSGKTRRLSTERRRQIVYQVCSSGLKGMKALEYAHFLAEEAVRGED